MTSLSVSPTKSKKRLLGRYAPLPPSSLSLCTATLERSGLMDCPRRASKQAKRFSKAMKAPLIFCSTSHSINVQKIFKIVLSKVRHQYCHTSMCAQAGNVLRT